MNGVLIASSVCFYRGDELVICHLLDIYSVCTPDSTWSYSEQDEPRSYEKHHLRKRGDPSTPYCNFLITRGDRSTSRSVSFKGTESRNSKTRSSSKQSKRSSRRKVRRKDGGGSSDDPSSEDDSDPRRDRSLKKRGYDSDSEPDDGDDEFYLTNRSIPSDLSDKVRDQMSRLFAKIRQTIEKTRRARRTLRANRVDVQEMTNDELITSVKADRRGYEHTIQELDTCREEMMRLSSLLGKRISNQQRRICQGISSDAQEVSESAEECMILIRDLVKRRQLRLNAVNPEVAKVSKVISFSGSGGLPHFYSWKRDVLAAASEIGMPVDNQGSYIITHLAGEAKDRVDSELAAVSRPGSQEVLTVLQKFFGQHHVITRQLIKAHGQLGAIPSLHDSTSWEPQHKSASAHRKLIISAKELSDAVGETETICSWAYQDAREAVLPPEEQRNLQRSGSGTDRRTNFKALERIFGEMEITSAHWMIRHEGKKPSKRSREPFTAAALGGTEHQTQPPPPRQVAQLSHPYPSLQHQLGGIHPVPGQATSSQ